MVADGDSDQVVATDLADLFEIKKASSRDRSAQLIVAMTEEVLRQVTEKRYSSRFGPFSHNSGDVEAGEAGGGSTSLPLVFETEKVEYAFPPQIGHDEPPPVPEARNYTPSSNEMRKRVTRGSTG